MDAKLEIILRNLRNAIDELLALDSAGNPAPEAHMSSTPPVPDVAPEPMPEPPAVPEPPAAPPAAPVPPAVPAVELDSEGLPWDERIHSSGKTQYKTGEKKGQWIIRKKTDPEVLEGVKAELRGQYPELPAENTIPVEGGHPVDAVPTAHPIPLADSMPPAPPSPPAETAPPAETGEPMSWGDLLVAITNAGLSPAEVQVACAKNHVANIGALQDSPSMVPAVAAELGLA